VIVAVADERYAGVPGAMAAQSPLSHVTVLLAATVVIVFVGAPDPATTLPVAGVAASCADVHTSTMSPRAFAVPANAAVMLTDAPAPTAVKIEQRVEALNVPTLTRLVNVSPVGVVCVWPASPLTTFATTIDPDGGVNAAVTSDVFAAVSP
jgi:hypothetical protein